MVAVAIRERVHCKKNWFGIEIFMRGGMLFADTALQDDLQVECSFLKSENEKHLDVTADWEERLAMVCWLCEKEMYSSLINRRSLASETTISRT